MQRSIGQPDTLWTKLLDRQSGGHFQYCNDDGFYSLSNDTLTRYDNLANPIWTKNYKSELNIVYHNEYSYRFTGLMVDSLHNILIGKFVSADTIPSIILIKFDSNGDTLYTKTIKTKMNPNKSFGIFDFSLTKDGGFILVLYNFLPGILGHNAHIIKTDSFGDTL